jgi:hypothetical protein
LLLTTLADFNLGIPRGMTNIETLFNPCLRVLKHVVGYHSHITYAGFQLLKITVFHLVDEVRNYFTYMMPGGWFGKGKTNYLASQITRLNIIGLQTQHPISE